MSAAIKIGPNSICTACTLTPPMNECTICYLCKETFHAVCASHEDGSIGSKTMVKTFVAASTKANFKFFCDECLTTFERKLAETSNDKLNSLVTHVSGLEKRLTELSNKLDRPDPIRSQAAMKSNFWNDAERLAKVKLPPHEAVLVIKKPTSNEENSEKLKEIQTTIVTNNIPMIKSYNNKAGDTIMVCETENDRDKLKTLIAESSNEIEMNAPAERRSQITIVGFKEEFTKEEIIKMMVLQNTYLKRFASLNEIEKHIVINAVRPLKNNDALFQAFGSVSKTVREGLSQYGNKITIGLATCKIYDRFHIKRCNICQHFGHYMKDCPNPNEHTCGKCGGEHSTKDCTDGNTKCINCVRKNIEDTNHCAYSYKCTSLIEQQNLLKNRLNYENRRSHQQP